MIRVWPGYNLWGSNIVDISGALFILRTQTHCDEGARDFKNIWVPLVTFFTEILWKLLTYFFDSNLNPPIILNLVFDILLHAAGIVLLMISSLQSLLSPLTRTWSRSICSLLVLILSSVLYRYLRSWWWRHNHDDDVIMMTSRSHEETSNFTFLSHLR